MAALPPADVLGERPHLPAQRRGDRREPRRRGQRAHAVPAPSAGDAEVLLHGVEHGAMHSGPAARARGTVRAGPARRALRVGSVGNLTPKKDQRTLILALEQLRASHPAARLVLIGTGPLEDELRSLVRGTAWPTPCS